MISETCFTIMRKRSLKCYLFLLGFLVILYSIFGSSTETDSETKLKKRAKSPKPILRQSDLQPNAAPGNLKRSFLDDFESDNLDLKPGATDPMGLGTFWKRVAGMSSPAHLYPSRISMYSMNPSIPSILNMLSSAKIERALLFDRRDEGDIRKEYGNDTLHDFGSTHKWLLRLSGGQLAMFKPLWYPTTYVREQWYEGFELANAEIASFHLDRLLQLNKVPFSVGRGIHVEREVFPVASDALRRVFTQRGSEWCISARCYMCERPVTVCTEHGVLQGAVIYHLPRLGPPTPHPWDIQHYHREKAHVNDPGRCQELMRANSIQHSELLDLADLAVLDFLSYNFDSRLYRMKLSVFSQLTVHVDRGRSFSSYEKEDDANLLILKECCRLRPSTVHRLRSLQERRELSGLLRGALQMDPFPQVLHQGHFPALDARLDALVATMDKCQL